MIRYGVVSLVSLFLSIVLPAFSRLAAMDAPHNEAGGVSCPACHGPARINSPFWGGEVTVEIFNGFCLLNCHDQNDPNGYNPQNAPYVRTHASPASGSQYGTWRKRCTACHDQHNHEQNNYEWRRLHGEEVYLASGTWEAGAFGGAGYQDNGDGTSTLAYESLTCTPGWDTASFLAKSSANRRAVLLPNYRRPGSNFVVESLTGSCGGAGTITVRGDVGPVPQLTRYGFRIIYGQYIRQYIDHDADTSTPGRPVRFFRNRGAGSFARDETGAGSGDDPTADGVCQVCHADTGHWSGNAPAVDKHFSAWQCTECHGHPDGFAASWPDHDSLITMPGFCSNCHGGTVFDLHQVTVADRTNCSHCHRINDNLNLAGSLPYIYLDTEPHTGKDKYMITGGPLRCDFCHHGQFGEHVIDDRPGVTVPVHDMTRLGYDLDYNDTPDNWIACDACHYADADMKQAIVEEHVMQRNFTCSTCHESAVAKVVAAIADGMAGNPVFCDDCHNEDDAFEPTGNLVDQHHASSYASNGDCTHCHVVGPGVDGPVKAPCTICHATAGRFPAAHSKAPTVDVADVADTRACFSCHLDGDTFAAGPGYRAGRTPAILPMHAYPSSVPISNWPGDVYVTSDQCPNCGLGLFGPGAIAGLPACTADPGSDQCDSFIDDIILIQQWTGPDGNTPEDQLLKRFPGFGLFHDIFQYQSRNYSSYGDDSWLTGTVMYDDDNLTEPNWLDMYGWATEYVRDNIQEDFLDISYVYDVVPISYQGSHMVFSLDGQGGGGQPSANTTDLTVTIEPAGAITAGAQWRVDGRAWQSSGATVGGLSNRTDHLLELKPLAGWVSPATGDAGAGPNVTATYEQCPDDARLSLTGGTTNVNWSDPNKSEAYSFSGWQPTGRELECKLDSDGASGFTVTSGTDTCTITKNGETASGAGTYNFVLEAQGSTCYGNSVDLPITVVLDTEGAKDPIGGTLEATIGSDYIDSEDIDLYNTNSYGTLFHIRDDLYGAVYWYGTTKKFYTFTIDDSGQISKLGSNPNISLNSSVSIVDYGTTAEVGDGMFLVANRQYLNCVSVDVDGVSSRLYNEALADTTYTRLYPLSGNNAILLKTVSGTTYLTTVSVSPTCTVTEIESKQVPAALNSAPEITWLKNDMHVLATGPNVNLASIDISDTGDIADSFIDTYTLSGDYPGNLFRVSDSAVGVFFKPSIYLEVGYLVTFGVNADGTFQGLVNQLSFKRRDTGVYDVLPLDNNYFAVSAGEIRGLMFTYYISDNGIIRPEVKDSFITSGAKYQRDMIHVNDNIYAIASRGNIIRTIAIE